MKKRYIQLQRKRGRADYDNDTISYWNSGSVRTDFSLCQRPEGERGYCVYRRRSHYAYNGRIYSPLDRRRLAGYDALSGDGDCGPSDVGGGHRSDVSHYLYGSKVPQNRPDSALRGADSPAAVYRVYDGSRRGTAHGGGLVYDPDVHYHCVYRRFHLYLYSGLYEGISLPSQGCAGQTAVLLFHAFSVPGRNVRSGTLPEHDLDVLFLGDHQCDLIPDDRIYAL